MYTQTYPTAPSTQTPAPACLGASKAQASTWSPVYGQNTMFIRLKMAEPGTLFEDGNSVSKKGKFSSWQLCNFCFWPH